MSEIKSLTTGRRVKILPPPNETHPLSHHVGVVQGVNSVRKNAAGVVIYKSYDIMFGHSAVREVEAKYLWPIE